MWVLAGLLAFGAVWAGILVWVTRARAPSTYAELSPKVARLRTRLLPPVLAVLLAGFLFSMTWLAYPSTRLRQLGEPVAAVDIEALQWAWQISAREVPAGVPVEFRVTARDVNHGLGIYDSSGRLLAQVQAMPRYTNHLIVALPAGTYTLRCLEYCGVVHHAMLATLIAN